MTKLNRAQKIEEAIRFADMHKSPRMRALVSPDPFLNDNEEWFHSKELLRLFKYIEDELNECNAGDGEEPYIELSKSETKCGHAIRFELL